jgi:hypothetical protein
LVATVYVLPPGPVHVPDDTDVIRPMPADCPLPAVKLPAITVDPQVTVLPVTPSWRTNVPPLLSGAVQLPPGVTVQVAVAAEAATAAVAGRAAATATAAIRTIRKVWNRVMTLSSPPGPRSVLQVSP